MGLIGLVSLIAVFMWMDSHRERREHREIIIPSVLSALSVANYLHTFENRYISPISPIPDPHRGDLEMMARLSTRGEI
jgi:hypothetical protein